MLRTLSIWLALTSAIAISLPAASPQTPIDAPAPASPQRALLNRYCVTCHNEKLKTADLMLDKADVQNVPAGAEVWEKVIRKVRTGAMPPAGMPRPDPAAFNDFATYLETSIDGAAAAKPNPGRPAAIHRLNRAEYTNVVRDLLGVEIDSETILPADESGYGFDNVGDVLSISPSLMERYMLAARKISRLAVGDPAVRPDSHTYNLSERLLQAGRMSEDLPFGTRGGIAFRYYFPADGEYSVSLTLRRSNSHLTVGTVVGLSEEHQLDVRVDGALVKRFKVGGPEALKQLHQQLLSRKAKLGESPSPKDPSIREADTDLNVRFQAKAGMRVVGVAFLDDLGESEGESEVIVRPPVVPLVNEYWRTQDGEPSVAAVSIAGPFDAKGVGDTASRKKIFVCHPNGENEEDLCARKILTGLARQAYRRPVTEADIRTLLGFYKTARTGGFEAGIETALQRMLVSPQFLFRLEHDPANAPPDSAYRITELELASRLSFFLWSSIPDGELLDQAERGKLKDPAVLEQQVRRMLRDSRSKALTENFAGQWLQLRSVRAAEPDYIFYPDFDDNLREAFAREMELFFDSMLRDDRSIVDLLSADYTFVNERLARHYGIPNVYGNRFRRVTLTDENRMGLLGKGSILLLTSYPNRTSPVLRGKFVLENILGTPPPPPPPNVPALKEQADDGKVRTVRQAMEQHRANPACATCHSRMDPLGFALDNFDGIGKWRTTEAGAPIDASGVLPGNVTFHGPSELRKIFMSHPEQFVNVVAENLLTYALGRGVEYYDQPAIRKMVRGAAGDDYRWSSLILGIVKSAPFQLRKSAEPVVKAAVRR